MMVIRGKGVLILFDPVLGVLSCRTKEVPIVKSLINSSWLLS